MKLQIQKEILTKKKIGKILLYIIFFAILVVIVSSVFSSIFCIFKGDSPNFERFEVAVENIFSNCPHILKQKATELSLNTSNKTDIVLRIGRWVADNITYVDFGTNNRYYKKCWNDCETLDKGKGPCGEKADLFRSLVNVLEIEGLEAFSIHGEGHQWNEVSINGENIFLDLSLGGDWFDKWFNISKMDYEKENYKNITLSKVIRVDKNYAIEDVTEFYTKTNILNVLVEGKNGKPMPLVHVIIKSHSLMEKEPEKYKQPEPRARCYTNSSGSCSFELGGNNYTIYVNKWGLVSNETTRKLKENGDSLKVNFTLDFDPDIIFISLFGFIIFVLICLSKNSHFGRAIHQFLLKKQQGKSR